MAAFDFGLRQLSTQLKRYRPEVAAEEDVISVNSITGNTLLDTGYFPPCRVATTGPITLSGTQTIDGVALNAGDRVLVWKQADATTNGIYAASSGTWVRTTDAASNADFFDGMRVGIALGNTYTAQSFQCTCADDPVVVGTSELTFDTVSDLQISKQESTSSTSLTVGTGSKTLLIGIGLDYSVNQWLLIFDAAGNAMLGQITAYNSSSGSLTVSVTATSGSGTHSDWTVVLANSSASAGLMPPLGTGNVTGPGSSTTGHLATFADGTGKVLADSGVAAGTLASRNQLLYGDAGTASISPASISPGAAPLAFVGVQPNDNLHLVNDATNATRDIDVTAGRVRDDSDVTNLQLAGVVVKRLDQAWAAGGVAGSPAGGCDTGTKGASQTWHIFLIGKLGQAVTSISRTSNVATLTIAGHGLGVGGTIRPQGIGSGFDGVAPITAVTTNTVSYANTGSNVGAVAPPATAIADGFDTLASQSYLAPTMPSGWTVKQCIGSILTDGSGNIRPFLQIGDRFMWLTPVLDQNAVASLRTNYAVSTPNGVKVFGQFQIFVSNSSLNEADMRVYSPDAADVTVGIDSSASVVSVIGAAGTVRVGTTVTDILTNTSAQIRLDSDHGFAFSITTIGYRDPRRRLF